MIKDRNIDPELAAIISQGTAQLEFEVLAAEGNYAAIHARAVEIGDKLEKMKVKMEGNQDFRTDALRAARTWQLRAALRLGNYEEAATGSRQLLDQPLFGRRIEPLARQESTAREKVRLGQALLGTEHRAEALAVLHEAEEFYRQQRAAGATDTRLRIDFVHALYQLSRAQAGDDAGRARRRALLDEAMGELGQLSVEAQQLVASKELLKWVTDARRALEG